jgi:hypothetical protein
MLVFLRVETDLECCAGSKEVAMSFLTPASVPVTRAFRPARKIAATHWRLLVSVVLLVGCGIARGQQTTETAATTVVDQQTLQRLLQRIDQLEARVRQLEAAQKEPATASTAAAPAAALKTAAMAVSPTAASPQAEPEPQAERPEPERMDVSKTLLRIRGFGDAGLYGDTHKGDKTSFSLGQLDLFVTSDVSEKFKFLSEIVFEAGPLQGQPANVFDVDVERYLLQYSHNDYFNVSIGRYHTAIGYYNTAYHHSTWFQTTTGRPFLFAFEDQGGILPIHNVGVSVSGQIPSGKAGLHYVAEVGNGRASRNPLTDEPVQNEVADKNHKAVNLAVFSRPTRINGLQTGVSVYHDLLVPLGLPPIGETIVAAHVVETLPHFEWLNEALLLRHSPQGLSHPFNTPGFYSQISKQWGAFRPYFRYQYVNAANNEPVFGDVGRRDGPSAGLRFDASESVALKLQYDYTFERAQPGISSLGLQVGFTF